jgi:hypothetical protein
MRDTKGAVQSLSRIDKTVGSWQLAVRLNCDNNVNEPPTANSQLPTVF